MELFLHGSDLIGIFFLKGGCILIKVFLLQVNQIIGVPVRGAKHGGVVEIHRIESLIPLLIGFGGLFRIQLARKEERGGDLRIQDLIILLFRGILSIERLADFLL